MNSWEIETVLRSVSEYFTKLQRFINLVAQRGINAKIKDVHPDKMELRWIPQAD